MEGLFYFIAAALFAEVLGTVGGFGSSILFVPIAAYFLDFQSVLGITAIFHVASNLTKIAMFRKGFDKNLLIRLGIPAVLFVLVGSYLSQYIDVKYLEISLSAFLISISLLFLLARRFAVKPSTFNAVSGGALSGFIAGLLGTGGAIRGLVLTAYRLPIETFIATSAIIDLGIDASRALVYSANGFVHPHDLYLIPILIVVSIAGTFIGKLILKKISEELFRNIVLLLILVTGIVTLAKAIMGA